MSYQQKLERTLKADKVGFTFDDFISILEAFQSKQIQKNQIDIVRDIIIPNVIYLKSAIQNDVEKLKAIENNKLNQQISIVLRKMISSKNTSGNLLTSEDCDENECKQFFILSNNNYINNSAYNLNKEEKIVIETIITPYCSELKNEKDKAETKQILKNLFNKTEAIIIENRYFFNRNGYPEAIDTLIQNHPNKKNLSIYLFCWDLANTPESPEMDFTIVKKWRDDDNINVVIKYVKDDKKNKIKKTDLHKRTIIIKSHFGTCDNGLTFSDNIKTDITIGNKNNKDIENRINNILKWHMHSETHSGFPR